MAQPPAGVVRTLKPEGELQLHRLSERARFYCVRCQRNKTHNLVATMNRNWSQTVCFACYSALVHAQREAKAQREKAKKKARKAAKQEAARATRQAADARAGLPGAYGLLAFLRTAGVRAELVGGRLCINGEQIQRIDHLPRPETFEWRRMVDKIVVEHIRDKFNTAVGDNAHFGNGLHVVPQWSESGFSIMRDDAQLAIIHPTRAYISDGKVVHAKVVHANFLIPGPHWQQVADALRRAVPELAGWKHEQEAKAATRAAAAVAKAEQRRATARRQIDQLPHNLGPERIAACLDASRRIRLERHLAYPRPIVLEYGGGELTILPIAATVTRLLVPFRLRTGTETLDGDLVISERDPLPLLIGENVAYEDAITAWTYALLGFADATCVELGPTEPPARRELEKPQQHPPFAATHHPPSVPTLPRRSRWPRHLEPVGRWVRYSDSIVIAHRRRLPDGWTASDEAHNRAREVGIILRPGETWVQAHFRGVPDGIEVRFRWHAPTGLKLFHPS
jgi:hypothetical protein